MAALSDLTLRSIAHTIQRQHPEKERDALAFALAAVRALGRTGIHTRVPAERAVVLWHQMYDEDETPTLTHDEHYMNAQAALTHETDVPLATVYMLMALYEAMMLPGLGISIGENADQLRRRDRQKHY